MESPSSTVRRQAWVQGSRQWLTLEESEPQGCTLPSTPHGPVLEDDVFSDGCVAGKIESWLLGCGPETGSEKSGRLTVESLLKASSFEDDLSLGAEATEFHGLEGSEVGSCPRLLPPPKARHKGLTTSTPHQKLSVPLPHLGYSMASSGFSSSTNKTASSVSEILQLCSEDAEETLYQLGFGCDEPQVTARIPTRFFNFPSHLHGINFRLFLQSQLQRLRQEDPSLSLASRFRQVEVLTAMANAFYSLYSHVSRTPVQKLAPPEFSFSSPTADRKIGRFLSSVRSEPRSPVERLKDTVSKMCLYTGSPRGSDSTSPHPSPRKRSSLPDLVVRSQDTEASPGKTAVKRNILRDGDAVCDKETWRGGQSDRDGAECGAVSPTDKDLAHSPRASLSGETEPAGQEDNQCRSNQAELDSCDAGENTRPITDLIPVGVGKVTYDVICHQIVECVHQAPYYGQQINKVTASSLSPISSEEDKRPDRSSLTSSSRQPSSRDELADVATRSEVIPAIPESEGHYHPSTGHVSSQEAALVVSPALAPPLPVPHPGGRISPCLITVTGWEGDGVISSSTPDMAPPTPSAAADQRPRRSETKGNRRYLSPRKLQTTTGVDSISLQQANSFELEEVHSAGEEDLGQSETTRSMNTLLSTVNQYKGLMVRGDSLQSDSSGYADEDVNPSYSSSGRQGR